eukprot:3977488-Alexandrium_andersonii.AAC.2
MSAEAQRRDVAHCDVIRAHCPASTCTHSNTRATLQYSTLCCCVLFHVAFACVAVERQAFVFACVCVGAFPFAIPRSRLLRGVARRPSTSLRSRQGA